MALKKKKTVVAVKLSRKGQRKQNRKEKKVRKNDYYTNRSVPGKFVLNPDKTSDKPQKKKKSPLIKEAPIKHNDILSTEEVRKKEHKEQRKVQLEMQKQRKKQMIEANLEEDRNIKRLEKQLKLNKRKSKAVPKSFAADGLDYLLEVCDSETMHSAVTAEQQLNEINDEFEEDFALMTGESTSKKVSKKIENDQDSDDEMQAFLNDNDEEESEDEVEEESDGDSFVEESEIAVPNKRKLDTKETYQKSKKKRNKKSEDNDDCDDFDEEIFGVSDNESINSDAGEDKKNEVWEDIYGRLRSKDGTVITKTTEKYIPPAIRAKMESQHPEEQKRIEKLNRLKKQLKGLVNRLAESNMHNIATQVEDLYMNNSRNDMNHTLTNLLLESLVSNAITPERLLMEHIMLVAILHANIGTEVGAHFLQTIAQKFDEFFQCDHEVENKSLDNVVNILAQLYNFKMFDSKLIYEILKKLSHRFEEKDVECILHILRSVGFSLRKDDPLALKNLIFELQKQAASKVPDETKDNSRVKFMLDILLAIKNNNVTKIPNYDTSYSEHLKKIMKSFIRKGNYIGQLNISLEDLLKADERGKWWVVGSAWTGNLEAIKTDGKSSDDSEEFSQKLLQLAKKQRMNTDSRRNIFCIIMSAEDYLDAFEKLLRLGLKNQQDREIIHVILHCCLQEKQFNPYYAVLAQKFCDYDRKYQMAIKYSVWDKLKSLNDHSGLQISNLAKLLTHLFIEKGLSISTLKIVQFSELDKITLRFMRQILLGILLHNNYEASEEVFRNVAQFEKLKMFRESLRLFIHHFLLKNLNSNGIPESQRTLLESRAKNIEKILASKQNSSLRF